MLGSSTNVAGCLFTSQKGSSQVVTDGVSNPALEYCDKTLGQVRNSFFIVSKAGITIDNSKVKVEHNIFSLGQLEQSVLASVTGVNVWRKSPKTVIASNVFNDCYDGIILRDGAQPLVKWNKLNLCRIMVGTSCSPNVFENIFTGQNQAECEDAKLTGIFYYSGGAGVCAKNWFNNFKNPDHPPIMIESSSQGFVDVGPRMLANTFSDCVPSNDRTHQDLYAVSSSEEEEKMNSIVGNKVRKEDTRGCVNCKKIVPCVLCKECKSVYYCGRQCQLQHWEIHQEYCTGYSEMKDKCPPGCQCCEMN